MNFPTRRSCALKHCVSWSKLVGVQLLYKHNAHVLRWRILWIVASDWLQRARSARGEYEYSSIHLLFEIFTTLLTIASSWIRSSNYFWLEIKNINYNTLAFFYQCLDFILKPENTLSKTIVPILKNYCKLLCWLKIGQ